MRRIKKFKLSFNLLIILLGSISDNQVGSIDFTNPGTIPTTDITTTTSEPIVSLEETVAPIQVCYENQWVNDTIIQWDNLMDDYNYYSSRPHCLHDNSNIILRFCINGKFTNEARCHHLQEPINFCPENFNFNGDYCYVVLEPLPYENSSCPYEYLVSYKRITNLMSDGSYWIPAKRSDSLGEFIVEEYSDYYGEIVENIVTSDMIKGHECVVYENKMFKAASCNETHRRICAYEFLHGSRHRYCDLINKYCISYSFNVSETKCICLLGDSPLAALQPYHNSLTRRYSVEVELSLKFYDSWTWDGVETNYTYWSDNIHSVDTNKIPHLTSTGWDFGEEEYQKVTIEENVCEIEEILLKPLTNLSTHSGSYLKIELENSDCLLHTPNDNKFITCFTDSKPESPQSVSEINLNVISTTDTGRFWCVAKHVTSNLIESNGITIYNHHIYPIVVTTEYEIGQDPTLKKTAYDKIILKYQHNYNEINVKNATFKWMKTLVLNENLNRVTYLIHIAGDLEFDHLEFYEELKLNLQNIFINSSYGKLHSLDYCLEETTRFKEYNLTWPTTQVFSASKSLELCLDESGLAITRNCNFNYSYGCKFEPVKKCFIYTLTDSSVTKNLTELLSSNDQDEILNELILLTETPSEFKSVDIYLVSCLLEKLDALNTTRLKELVYIISNVMSFEKVALNESQIELNSTDRILYEFDGILEYNKNSSMLIFAKNLIVHLIDLALNPINGFALLKNSSGYEYTLIHSNSSVHAITDLPNLETGVFIPNDVLDVILSNGDTKAILIIFMNDHLFNENNLKREVVSKNLALLLPKITFPSAVSLLYNYPVSGESFCHFWKYGYEQKGNWFEEGASIVDGNIKICEITHVTHFGLLIINKAITANSQILDIITYVESSFSMFGVLGVLLTGILFENWRNNKGNQILLHYSGNLFIQIILLFVSQAVFKNGSLIGCIITGALLHYAVLCQFCWMLIIAYFQYRRYVKVFYGNNVNNFMISCLLSYTLPAFPVLLLLSIDPYNYTISNVEFCYPTNFGLIFGILVPISFVVLINIGFFAIVIYELFYRRDRNYVIKDDTLVLRLRLVILMFFLLGLTWVFGILAQLFQNTLFLYLFNITACMQGFVIFLFFIAFNKSVRQMYVCLWKKYIS